MTLFEKFELWFRLSDLTLCFVELYAEWEPLVINSSMGDLNKILFLYIWLSQDGTKCKIIWNWWFGLVTLLSHLEGYMLHYISSICWKAAIRIKHKYHYIACFPIKPKMAISDSIVSDYGRTRSFLGGVHSRHNQYKYHHHFDIYKSMSFVGWVCTSFVQFFFSLSFSK